MRRFLALSLLAACGTPSATTDARLPETPTVSATGARSDGGVPIPGGGAVKSPPKTCEARAYGAKGDGTTSDTGSIQAAIDDCAGNGVVRLEDGTFSSGMLRLKSGTTLWIDTTATLKGTQDDADYPTQSPPTTNTQLSNCRKSLVYAESATDITIDGGGTIDGNGNTPKWIGGSPAHPEATRPMAIYTALSKNVTIQNVTVKNAAMWGVVNLEADNLTIRNVTVDSELSGNRDGIDVVDCHHTLIDGVTITSEDDSICIKSGAARGVDDLVVRNSHVKRSIVANGLKFGTASYGAFRNALFENIVVENVDKAAMAVESVDGSDISNIVFRHIVVHGAGSPFFVILGDRGITPSDQPHKVGSVDGVRFEDVSIDGMKYDWSSPISGTRLPDGSVHTLRNLVFQNVRLVAKGGLTAVPADPPEYAGQYPDPNLWGNLPGFGYFVRHADGVVFRASIPTASAPDGRGWLAQRDVVNLAVDLSP